MGRPWEILRSPATTGLKLTGRSVKARKIARDVKGLPIRMAKPLFTEDEWAAIQAAMDERSVTKERSNSATVSARSSSCSRRPAGSGRRPSAMRMAWPTSPVTASCGVAPSLMGPRMRVEVSWGRASMLSASRTTRTGSCPEASAVTSAATAAAGESTVE
ncbi:recombinase family protein [Kitasatospora sp. NPDC127067]|uniref:recombinase family protein n=1 Tax=Kitasatospora sp. NPDC127067 TaxID=3347126 RepID=UPI003657B63C